MMHAVEDEFFSTDSKLEAFFAKEDVWDQILAAQSPPMTSSSSSSPSGSRTWTAKATAADADAGAGVGLFGTRSNLHAKDNVSARFTSAGADAGAGILGSSASSSSRAAPPLGKLLEHDSNNNIAQLSIPDAEAPGRPYSSAVNTAVRDHRNHRFSVERALTLDDLTSESFSSALDQALDLHLDMKMSKGNGQDQESETSDSLPRRAVPTCPSLRSITAKSQSPSPQMVRKFAFRLPRMDNETPRVQSARGDEDPAAATQGGRRLMFQNGEMIDMDKEERKHLRHLDIPEGDVQQFQDFAKELTEQMRIECASANPYVQALAAHREEIEQNRTRIEDSFDSLEIRLATRRQDALATLQGCTPREATTSGYQASGGTVGENWLPTWPPICVRNAAQSGPSSYLDRLSSNSYGEVRIKPLDEGTLNDSTRKLTATGML
jgi:hypothetical protein